jgi:hypothetical protein
VLLDTRNVCTVLDVARVYSLASLERSCLDLADTNASEILNAPGFTSLTPVRRRRV